MKKIILSLVLLGLLTACGDKKETAQTTESSVSSGLDVGKIELVQITVSGMGMTPGAAINDALKTAVSEVNGVRVESAGANLNVLKQVTAEVDVESSRGADNARINAIAKGQAFAEAIVTQSRGLVNSFRVIDISQTGNNSYTAEIEARIAKYKAPQDAGKIKIVVAPLRSPTSTFNIGGRRIPADQVLSPIRQQIIDSLIQTGRFTVLDRQFDSELQNELDMIDSGQSVNTDFAKLGQALSADVVWVGVVNELAYNRNVRKLITSDRDLVSFSGGWSVSQRVINLATRQILQSSTLQGSLPSTAPTTLGAGIDEVGILKNIENSVARKATEAIIHQIFPVSVVELNGNHVVLSQGGQAVKTNRRYLVYLQGKELKDPQTGQSLGRTESPCCEVVVTRVAPKLSYGVLENVQIDLANVQPGALLVKEMVPDLKPDSPSFTPEKNVAHSGKKSKTSPHKPVQAGVPGGRHDDW